MCAARRTHGQSPCVLKDGTASGAARFVEEVYEDN